MDHHHNSSNDTTSVLIALTDLRIPGINRPDHSSSSLILFSVFYIVVFLMGILGNVFTIGVITNRRYLQTVTNFYLSSLALSDIFLLIFGLPVDFYHLWYPYPAIGGTWFCILRAFLFEAAANVSILTIVAFTVERWVAICRPFQMIPENQPQTPRQACTTSYATSRLRSMTSTNGSATHYAAPCDLARNSAHPDTAANCKLVVIRKTNKFSDASVRYASQNRHSVLTVNETSPASGRRCECNMYSRFSALYDTTSGCSKSVCSGLGELSTGRYISLIWMLGFLTALPMALQLGDVILPPCLYFADKLPAGWCPNTTTTVGLNYTTVRPTTLAVNQSDSLDTGGASDDGDFCSTTTTPAQPHIDIGIKISHCDIECSRYINYSFEASALAFFFCPMALITIAYISIVYTLHRRLQGCRSGTSSPLLEVQHSIQYEMKAKKAVIRMLIIVVAVFFFCFFPHHFQRLLTRHSRDTWLGENVTYIQIMDIFYHTSGNLLYFSAVINPIIYNVFSRRFRKGFVDLAMNFFKPRPVQNVRFSYADSSSSSHSRRHSRPPSTSPPGQFQIHGIYNQADVTPSNQSINHGVEVDRNMLAVNRQVYNIYGGGNINGIRNGMNSWDSGNSGGDERSVGFLVNKETNKKELALPTTYMGRDNNGREFGAKNKGGASYESLHDNFIKFWNSNSSSLNRAYKSDPNKYCERGDRKNAATHKKKCKKRYNWNWKNKYFNPTGECSDGSNEDIGNGITTNDGQSSYNRNNSKSTLNNTNNNNSRNNHNENFRSNSSKNDTNNPSSKNKNKLIIRFQNYRKPKPVMSNSSDTLYKNNIQGNHNFIEVASVSTDISGRDIIKPRNNRHKISNNNDYCNNDNNNNNNNNNNTDNIYYNKNNNGHNNGHVDIKNSNIAHNGTSAINNQKGIQNCNNFDINGDTNKGNNHHNLDDMISMIMNNENDTDTGVPNNTTSTAIKYQNNLSNEHNNFNNLYIVNCRQNKRISSNNASSFSISAELPSSHESLKTCKSTPNNLILSKSSGITSEQSETYDPVELMNDSITQCLAGDK